MQHAILRTRRSDRVMCDALRELFKDELEDAHQEGIKMGKDRLKLLCTKLEQDGRREELFQALNNPESLKKLYEEYGLA